MIKTRSDALQVFVINTQAGGGSAVVINNSSNLSVTIQNSAGWLVGLNAGGALIGTINTIAIGAGNNVTVTNSGGLFAQQSGPWTVTVANTGGTALSQTIANTAGWVVAVSNTSPLVSVQNSAGWTITIANTGGTTLSQTIANTAGWAVFELDSAAVGSVVTQVASTIGAVTLAASNTKRVAFSVYNASANPLFLRLGASASTASYSLMMVGSGYYELARPIYNGLITGIWQTANGFAYVTETT